MLEVYSIDVAVAEATPIPFNNVSLEKGSTVTLSGTSTIQLNKCGVYMVAVDGVVETETTIQLYKDGVLQPQAQSGGVTLGFTTLVQVSHNNGNCCCQSPVTLQIINDTATTFTNVNVVVTKVC